MIGSVIHSPKHMKSLPRLQLGSQENIMSSSFSPRSSANMSSMATDLSPITTPSPSGTASMASGSPSHISNPIQINGRRRRLFPINDGSSDSGIDSPSHIYRRSTFQESASVIYEDLESVSPSLLKDDSSVFTFEDDQTSTQQLFLHGSPGRQCTMLSHSANRSSPFSLSLNDGASPVHHYLYSPLKENYQSNPASRSSPASNNERRHLMSPFHNAGKYSPLRESRPQTLHLSSSLPVNERYINNRMSSPMRSSPSPLAYQTACHQYTPLDGEHHHHTGRRRSRSDPSAPPLYLYEDIEGYELTTAFSSVCMLAPSYCHGNEPPPPYEEAVDHRQSPPYQRTLSEEDAIEALSKFVANTCCHGSAPKKILKTVKAKEIYPGNEHQYFLETFYEERTTIWYQEPYTTQLIDGPENGPPPKAWDIKVVRPPMFLEREIYKEVPHTASVKDCSCCHGKGTRHCNCCHGTGEVKCSVCDGLGMLHHYTPNGLTYDRSASSVVNRYCESCKSGRRACKHCDGNGRKTCNTCQGHGHLKTYIRLTVKWKVLKADKILECSRLPKKYITEVSGNCVFQEENDRVYPLIDFPEDQINDLSRTLINNHKSHLKHAQIIMQRHCVREVPVSEVRSEYKRKEFTYWVYGNENHVYCPDNPVKCYNNCSIL